MRVLVADDSCVIRQIIVDRMMPFKDGLEVARTIRNTDSETPILLVTAHCPKRQRAMEAAEAGATDVLLKPFGAATLQEKLRKYCLSDIA